MARRGAAVVVVDAFRASTTISVLVSKGARVVPVNSITEAAGYEADLRIGERGSAKVAGFDFGNSPMELLEAEIPAGSAVVLSTTNGTRVVEAAAGAPCILTGAFVNAGALAGALMDEQWEEVAVRRLRMGRPAFLRRRNGGRSDPSPPDPGRRTPGRARPSRGRALPEYTLEDTPEIQQRRPATQTSRLREGPGSLPLRKHPARRPLAWWKALSFPGRPNG